MLILTRCMDEAIFVGDDIQIRVLDIQGGKVRIGVEAPRSISVHREEVYNRIQECKDYETEEN